MVGWPVGIVLCADGTWTPLARQTFYGTGERFAVTAFAVSVTLALDYSTTPALVGRVLPEGLIKSCDDVLTFAAQKFT